MGQKHSLEDDLITFKLTSKQFARSAKKCEKNQAAQKEKLKKAIEQGNMEGAKIYAQNVIREKNQALNALGLTDFNLATILAKLGTNKLSNIPLGKTLTDLIQDSQWKTGHNCNCSTPHCNLNAHTDYNTRKTESEKYHRIFTKLSGKVSESELTTLLNTIQALAEAKQELKENQNTTKSSIRYITLIPSLKRSQAYGPRELNIKKEKEKSKPSHPRRTQPTSGYNGAGANP